MIDGSMTADTDRADSEIGETYSADGMMEQYDPSAMGTTSTVEIPLDPELLTSFCRRGRRRLRDIQHQCQAVVKLDRTHGCLRVTGTESAISAVQRHLAGLGGPRKAVPAAVWAELMRTRTISNTSTAAIAHLQEESGCRIHIERSRQEVRLFGPTENVTVADILLEELAPMCTEKVVMAPNTMELSCTMLQALAHSCGVTLRVEEQQIVVLGLKAAVASASAELAAYVAHPNTYYIRETTHPATIVAEAMSHLTRAHAVSLAKQKGIEIPLAKADVQDGNEEASQSVDFSAQTPSNGAVAPSNKIDEEKSCCRTCPTCGSGRFCSSCGNPTWLVPSLSLAPYSNMQQPMKGNQWTVGMKNAADDMSNQWGSMMQFVAVDARAMMPGQSGMVIPAGMMPNTMMPICVPAVQGTGAEQAPYMFALLQTPYVQGVMPAQEADPSMMCSMPGSYVLMQPQQPQAVGDQTPH